MRDEFSKNTKIVLAMSVGLTCSNPSCFTFTGGPDENVGVASHITAASPGGPRYDSSLTPKDRKSEINGIWLCQKCAKLIDSPVHEEQYPKNLLYLWKNIAQNRSKTYVGKTSPFLGDLRPVSSKHGHLLELALINNDYQLYEAISGHLCTYSTTSTVREQVAENKSPSNVLEWATEILLSSWESEDIELLSICATLLSTMPNQWLPKEITLSKLESLCQKDIVNGDHTRISTIEPLLFAVAAKGHKTVFSKFIEARIEQNDFRNAEDAMSTYYYGSDGEQAAAVARHLRDPARTGFLRVNDIGRLLSLLTKPSIDLSRPRVRELLTILLRESIYEAKKANNTEIVELAIKYLKSYGFEL